MKSQVPPLEGGLSHISTSTPFLTQFFQLKQPMKDTGLTEIFKLLNENLERVVASGEKDVANLLFVLDILFNVLTYRTGILFISTTTTSTFSLRKYIADEGVCGFDQI